jgi:hypothetical protein
MKDVESMGVSSGFGGDAYITAKTDIDGLSAKYPFMSVRVKDVNGNRATINIGNFSRLSKEAAFTDRIRQVLLYPKHSPEEKQSGFMDNIFEIGKSKLLPSKRKGATEPIKPIDGIKFINNSTVTPSKQTEFIEALKDLKVRAHLKKYGITEFIIEPPYKFELSGQANIDKKNHVIRVNADATNIINSVLHEIGHVDYSSLSKKQQEGWETILAGVDNKAVNGYKKLNLLEEAYAETFAHQGEKWADEALAAAKPLPPKLPKAKPSEAVTEEIKGEAIPEPTPKVEKEKVEVTPEKKEPWEVTKDEFVRDKELKTIAEIKKKQEKYKKTLKNKSTADYYARQKYPYTPSILVELQERERKHHKKIIQQALKEGKTIPQEVLKDYPDLELEKPTGVSEGRAIEYIPSEEKHIKRYVPITRKEADDLFDKGAAMIKVLPV